MELGLGYITNNKNALNKDYHEKIRVTGVVLKENTSTTNPTFIVNLDSYDVEKISDMGTINYLHWFQTGRYYFVEDINYLRGSLVELTCHVDVLYTFKDDILDSSLYCVRSGNRYSPLIPDDNYTILNNYNCKASKICDTPYPEGSKNWLLVTATS